jgi:hypothetical protein
MRCRSRSFGLAWCGLLVSLIALVVAIAGSKPSAAVDKWEAVVTDGGVPIDGKANGVAFRFVPNFAIRWNGVWIDQTMAPSLLGIVDAGSSTATAYFGVQEGLYGVGDLSGDGNLDDFQVLFLTVGSPVLQVAPGFENQAGWSSRRIVQPSAITSIDGSIARQYRGNGVVTSRSVTPTPGPIPHSFKPDTWGMGRYLVKPDGTMVDSGLYGDVIGAVGETPIVWMITSSLASGYALHGDIVVATTPPRVVAPPDGGPAGWGPTGTWMGTTEAIANIDANADGDRVDLALCHLEVGGFGRCLPRVVIGSPPQPTVFSLGDGSIIMRGFIGPDSGAMIPSDYLIRGLDAPVKIASGFSPRYYPGFGTQLLREEVPSNDPSLWRYRFSVIGPNGKGPVLEDFSGQINEVVALPSGRFVVNVAEPAGGNRNLRVAHLLSASTDLRIPLRWSREVTSKARFTKLSQAVRSWSPYASRASRRT